MKPLKNYTAVRQIQPLNYLPGSLIFMFEGIVESSTPPPYVPPQVNFIKYNISY